MCSICGIIDFENKHSLNTDITLKMSDTMKNRGPDAFGIIENSFSVFAHNRLAVMDIENGKQPMSTVFCGRKYTIVYNGEIYNFKELRAELENSGAVFKTKCDTEVVLYSYIFYKEKCVERLNGIFAFAVVDEEEQRVFLARDRFGVKPFFYTSSGSSLLIASEIKALLKHPDIKPEVTREGLWQMLFLSPVTINGSGIFKNIYEIKPGFAGYFTKQGLQLRQYWSLTAKELDITADEAAEHTKALLCDAIRRQTVSDAPLAVLLSGGLDSSVVSAVASEAYKSRGLTLSTYSFEYEDNKKNFQSSLFQPQGDDEYAVWLAEHLGTRHTVLTAPTERVWALLTDAVKARDIPGQADIDSSLLYFCSEIKREHTVVLSGECADEIFGGYPWFYRKEMVESGFFPWIHSPLVRPSLFCDDFAKTKEGFDFVSEVYRKSIEDAPIVDGEPDDMRLSRIATWLSCNWFMTSLLERKDRMSMASGLEVRVPFSDHRLLEFVYNLPWSIKFEDGVEKALLRRAMKTYLPDKILYRKKSPYPKTHNPLYEEAVTRLLRERMEMGSPISDIIDKSKLSALLSGENITWFGQLMSRPQLIAWLIQFDFWVEEYGVNFVN